MLQIVSPHTLLSAGAVVSPELAQAVHYAESGRFLMGQVDKMKKAAPRPWKHTLTTFFRRPPSIASCAWPEIVVDGGDALLCAGAVHETREADEEREVDQLDWAEQQLGALMRGAWVAVNREKICEWEQQLMESYARCVFYFRVDDYILVLVNESCSQIMQSGTVRANSFKMENTKVNRTPVVIPPTIVQDEFHYVWQQQWAEPLAEFGRNRPDILEECRSTKDCDRTKIQRELVASCYPKVKRGPSPSATRARTGLVWV